MNHLSAAMLLVGLLLSSLAPPVGDDPPTPEPPVPSTALSAATLLSGPDAPVPASPHATPEDVIVPEDANGMIDEYCTRCHNERRLRGNLSLEGFDAGTPAEKWETAERMIRKLRAGMMPPAGADRPPEDSLMMLAATLENRIDDEALEDPVVGVRPYQRLTRAEYARAVWDLLGLQVDVEGLLPSETMSGGYDNVADVQTFSATRVDAYLTAAGEISRLALGDPEASAKETTYRVSRYAEQRERVPGAPVGTRGGLSVIHNFPADGDYVFRASFQHESTGNFFGATAPFDENLEVSIDGERRALVPIDRHMHRQDPTGVTVQSEPVHIKAGPKRVSIAFLETFEGPIEDVVSPHEWSLADKKIGYSYGITPLAHMRDAVIGGPYDVTGVSDFEVREKILTCHPDEGDEARPCAEEIIRRLARDAYRRPLTDSDVAALMELYDAGEADGGFESGVQVALQGILASPDFLFRMEEPAGEVAEDGTFPLNDLDLASRLSFFLWGAAPDDELLQLAQAGVLSEDANLEAQVRRMLADPRAESLGSRFAHMWLRLQDLDKVHPDALRFPDFYQQLADDMTEETERFFVNLIREDRSFFDILTADYSFMNERLARHYGIPGVTGDHFRRVEYANDDRRGVLGHGSILTLTSHANRTSPVLRGKWIMEVMLGTPPPPPPPNVPELEEEAAAEDGRLLTVKEKMEMHRANPSCNSCHVMIDPLGLALENFDVTGAWRIRDNGMPIVVEGELYDGTPLQGPNDLRSALLKRKESLVRGFTENLLAYALGRRTEYFDMPTIRSIEARAAAEDYRMSSFILGVVESPAFRMGQMPTTDTTDSDR
jgi:hypothetical protein